MLSCATLSSLDSSLDSSLNIVEAVTTMRPCTYF
jgi:hypothetical protein